MFKRIIIAAIFIITSLSAQWPFGKDVEWYIEGPKKAGQNAIMIDIIDGETDCLHPEEQKLRMSRFCLAKKQY